MTEKTGLQISGENYLKSAKTLALMVENITGIAFPEQILFYWQTMMPSIRVGDDRLDAITDKEERIKFREHVMLFLWGHAPLLTDDIELINSMNKLKSVCDSLPPHNKKSLLDTFEALLKVTEKLRWTTDARIYAKLTRVEGQITSRLFLATLPEGLIPYHKLKSLIKTFTRFGRFADIIDSVADLKDDYREGQVLIKPAIYALGQLVVSSLPDALTVFRHLNLFRLNLLFDILGRTGETLANNPRKPSRC